MTVPIQRYRVLELVDCGDDVVAVIEATGTGTRSGVTGTVSCGQLETWRDGKVTKIRYFTSKEAAREAAGLSK
jgi:ketosteroid isomerase-like protein